MNKIISKYWDYLVIIAIWIAIFGKNAFSQLVFVDYAPSTYFDLGKRMVMSNFYYTSYILDFLKGILSIFGVIQILFTISILIAMLVSYFYIRRTFAQRGKIYIFSLIYCVGCKICSYKGILENWR